MGGLWHCFTHIRWFWQTFISRRVPFWIAKGEHFCSSQRNCDRMGHAIGHPKQLIEMYPGNGDFAILVLLGQIEHLPPLPSLWKRGFAHPAGSPRNCYPGFMVAPAPITTPGVVKWAIIWQLISTYVHHRSGYHPPRNSWSQARKISGKFWMGWL